MDLLVGSAGNDRRWGDFREVTGNAPAVFSGGANRFVFENGSGLDTVFDFQDDVDPVDLAGFAGITGFAPISANAVAGGVGNADTIIDLRMAAGDRRSGLCSPWPTSPSATIDATDFLI